MDPVLIAVVLFVFAVIIGFDVIGKVPPTLHTPLVVASHAMAAIMVVSAILVAGEGSEASSLSKILAVIALLLGVINVVGGYLVADRMLAKFKNTKPVRKA
ncbi:MAG: proton-translocating transhydrogenase family protein [Spirochaetales bacterium]